MAAGESLRVANGGGLGRAGIQGVLPVFKLPKTYRHRRQVLGYLKVISNNIISSGYTDIVLLYRPLYLTP